MILPACSHCTRIGALLFLGLNGLLAAALAQGSTLENIAASKEIRIGIDVPYGRMEFYRANGELDGVDVAIAREISATMDAKPAFMVMPFIELFDALRSGKLDLVISAVTITAERQKSMRFSVPYFDAALQVAVRKADPDIRELTDLTGR